MRRLSKLICPVCKEFGGTLTLRTAGNTKKKNRRYSYIYIKHSSPSSNHKNKSYYIGHTFNLIFVKLNDPRYQTYENTVKSAYEYNQRQNESVNLRMKAADLLRSMGFPRRYLNHKFTADTAKALLEKEYEKRVKIGKHDDFRNRKFYGRLHCIVEKGLGKKLRRSKRSWG